MKRLFLLLLLLAGTASAGVIPGAPVCDNSNVGIGKTIFGLPPSRDCQIKFNYPGDGSLIYRQNSSTAATLDRNSTTSFIDHEGLLVPVSRNDEAVFTGMRRLMNNLANSSTPATQNVTLNVGKYMLQVAGTGSATSAAVGATVTGAGAASAGSPNIFTVTSYGTVSVTVAGSLTGFALYNITGESDQTTQREFIQSDVYYDGQAVPGVRYYNTAVNGTALTTGKGFSYQPATTNKIAGAYNAIGPDILSAEIASGNLTKGKRYQITARTDADFTADGAANNNVGTAFTATGTSVTLDAGDKVKEVQGAKSDGTGVSGLGLGAKAYRAAVATWNNPLPGITGSGGTDGESSIEIVSDTAKLASAKLTRLLPAGKVYKAVAGASASMDITFTGNLSAAIHTISVYARGASASDDAILMGDAVGGMDAGQALTDSYQLMSRTYTAGASGTKFTIPAGDTVYFCLTQSEALTVPTARVIVEGAAASRLRDDWTAPVADGINFSQAAGTVTVEWTAGFDSSSIPNGGYFNVINNSANLNGIMLVAMNAGVMTLGVYDGTNLATVIVPPFSKGDSIIFKTTWSKTRNKKNVYASTASGTGWGSSSAYDGAFIIGSFWYIGYNSIYPFSIANITVTNAFDKGGL